MAPCRGMETLQSCVRHVRRRMRVVFGLVIVPCPGRSEFFSSLPSAKEAGLSWVAPGARGAGAPTLPKRREMLATRPRTVSLSCTQSEVSPPQLA